MIDIPRWLSAHFERDNFSCPKCDHPFDVKSVTIIGIRAVDNSSKTTLYIEYLCPKCNGKIGFQIFEMTLEEFAVAVIDDMQDGGKHVSNEKTKCQEQKAKKIEKPPLQKQSLSTGFIKSKITLEEKNDAIKMLNKSENWIDWLASIGAPLDKKNEKLSGFYIPEDDQ